MASLREAADDFLAQRRIAVFGVSRTPNQAANLVYRTLRKTDHEVFAINPSSDEVEGDRCYHDLASIPGGVDAAVVATPPAAAESVVRQCAARRVTRIWLHRSFGEGSVSPEAAAFCRENGIRVIEGGCPMMFVPGADFGHKCMRFVLGLTGRLPKQVQG
jgi:predicted CoA-binding protein